MVEITTKAGRSAFTAALAAVVVGVSVLVGWLLDLDALKHIVPGLIAMNPATAIGFVFAGSSLAFFLRPPRGRNRTARAGLVAARICAAAVALIGLLKCVAVLGGWQNGVDQWFFASRLSEGLQLPNRMALNTALSFLLLGSALLVVDVPHRSVRLAVELSAIVIGLGSLLAVLAYAYDLQLQHGLGAFVRMALHTAITFLVLVVAILLSHTDGGLLAVFAGDSAGGTMARYLLPAAVLVPAALGLVTRQGEEAGFYTRAFGEAGFVVGSILLLTFLICWTAKRLFSADVRRTRDEHTLRESAAFLQAQVHSSLDGMLVVDQEGKQILQNQRFVEIFGIPRQIADQPADEPRLRWVTGRTAQPEQFVNRVRHLYAHPDEVGRDEIELKDGTLLDRYSTPVIGQDGSRYGRLWVFRDITEHQQAEEALRRSEQRYRTLVETARDFIFTFTPQGIVTSINSEFLAATGWALEECVGRSYEGLVQAEDRPRARELFVRAIRGEGLPSFDLLLNRRAGEPMPTEFTLSSRAKGLQVIELLGIGRDISDRKRAQAELSDIHQQLVNTSRQAGMAEVATNVLHNVGNVLNSVNISTGVIVETVQKSRTSSLGRVVTLLQEHAHDLGAFISQDARGQHLPAHLATLSEHLMAEQAAIVRELESLQRNVEHIKDIVAMQQSYAAVGAVRQTIDVASLVEDSLRLNEDAFSRHRVEVIREFEPVPPLHLEKHKLLQILVNLLSNAKSACDMAGRMDHRVTVRVANGDGRVRISVMDNGIGIPAENLTRMFSHGFTTRPGGHGFGLHGSALAAKELGGSLIAHSAGLGQGATFTLEMPILKET